MNTLNNPTTPDPMNTTKDEQIAIDLLSKIDPELLTVDNIKTTKTALIQYATEQNKELVEACRPFALYAEYHDSYPGYKKNREDSLTLFEHWHYEKDGTSARITAGHLRTLAALLTELEERKRE